MKNYLILFLIFTSTILHSQYYDFPFIGWKQTYTSYVWTGVTLETGIASVSFDQDSILDGQSYITDGFGFYRSEDGKIFQNKYDCWNTTFHYS